MHTTQAANLIDRSYLAPKEVALLTSLSSTTIWRLVKAGELAAPVRMSRGRVAYRKIDVDAYLAKCNGPRERA